MLQSQPNNFSTPIEATQLIRLSITGSTYCAAAYMTAVAGGYWFFVAHLNFEESRLAKPDFCALHYAVK